jgi:EmrB/QacA subfamily drug resistance transporter
MGMIGTIVSLGIVLGPALGGIILETLSWRWIFYVNLPVGIIGTLIVARNVPAYKPQGRQQFDYLGAGLLFSSLFTLLMGLTLGQQWGFFQPWVYGLVLAALVLLAVFIWVEGRVDQPMIELKIFRNSLLSVSLATGFISFVGLGGTLILIPFYLENILRFAPIHVGLLMGIVPVMLGICSPIAGSLSDRVGTRPLAVLGLAMMCMGYLTASTLAAGTTSWGYALRIFAVGAGIGVFISPNNSAIMGTAERRHLGIVSGLMAVTRTLGQTVGVAVMGAAWAGRTAYYAGTHMAGGATLAPAEAQIAALNDTFRVAALLLGFALILGIWAARRESGTPEGPSA